MKRRHTLAAFGLTCAATSCAYAQGSVTLYGITDVGVEVANHVPGPNGTSGTAVRMESGSLAGSRWGLRGTEDLGGGLKAIFVLENGYSINNGTLGQGGRLFGRKAYVGLSTPYGDVTLGRQYNLLYDLMYVYDALQFNPSYSAQGYDATLVGRADNAVRYTARFSGVTFAALYSTGFDSTIRKRKKLKTTTNASVPSEPRTLPLTCRTLNGARERAPPLQSAVPVWREPADRPRRGA